MRPGLAVLAVGVAASTLATGTARADELVEQRIQARDREYIREAITDQIQAITRGAAAAWSATRVMRFSGDDSDFDKNNPFGVRDASDPFAALAYTKAYTKAPPPPPTPVWIYGINAIGSFDRTSAVGTIANTWTGTVAFDVTKIGIFTTSDALTFLATGSDSWSHLPAAFFNSSTPSGSGTLAYTNGGFSADLTATASWTTNSATAAGVFAPTNSSMMVYTANAQYKWDFAQTWFVEPTVGAVYYDFFTPNFGVSTGTATEVHGGGRVGTEIMVNGIKLQPQFSAGVFDIITVSGAGGVAAAGNGNVAAQLNQVGTRAAAKLNFVWTSNFSSYIEAHGSQVAGIHTNGVSAGLRYSF